MPILSVVIPTKRDISKLQEVLINLRENITVDMEIIIVYAEDYDDDTKKWIMSQPYLTPVSDNNEPSIIKILNIGFRGIVGKYAAQWSDDAFLTKGTIEEGIDYLEKHDDVGGVVFDMHLVNVDSDNKKRRRYGFRYMEYRGGEKVVFLNSGIMRTEVIRKAGFYDERYISYYGQPDLTIKIREEGYKIVALPNCKIVHYIEEDALRIKNMKSFPRDQKEFLKKWDGIADIPRWA